MFQKSKKYVFILLISLLPGVAFAAVAYKEKIHYEAVTPAQPTSVEEGKSHNEKPSGAYNIRWLST